MAGVAAASWGRLASDEPPQPISKAAGRAASTKGVVRVLCVARCMVLSPVVFEAQGNPQRGLNTLWNERGFGMVLLLNK